MMHAEQVARSEQAANFLRALQKKQVFQRDGKDGTAVLVTGNDTKCHFGLP